MELPAAVAAAAKAKPHCAVALEERVDERVDVSGEHSRTVQRRWLQRCPEERGGPTLLETSTEEVALPRVKPGLASSWSISSVRVVGGGAGASDGGGAATAAAAALGRLGVGADGARRRPPPPPPGAVSL